MTIDITGISNENEFYTHHYLSAILEKDLKDVFKQWNQRSQDTGTPQPQALLGSLRKPFFTALTSLEREKDTQQRLSIQRKFAARLLSALGYEYHFQVVDLDDAGSIPLLGGIQKPNGAPDLWIMESLADIEDSADPLEMSIDPAQYPEGKADTSPRGRIIMGQAIEEVITRHVFGRSEPPRWVLLMEFSRVLLLDRTKWHEKRVLRFDIREILDRRETTTLQAMAALLHKDSICPTDGTPYWIPWMKIPTNMPLPYPKI